METQLTLAMMNDELGQARTSKKEFLDKIESIIPWDTFKGIIAPCYYKKACQQALRRTKTACSNRKSNRERTLSSLLTSQPVRLTPGQRMKSWKFSSDCINRARRSLSSRTTWAWHSSARECLKSEMGELSNKRKWFIVWRSGNSEYISLNLGYASNIIIYSLCYILPSSFLFVNSIEFLCKPMYGWLRRKPGKPSGGISGDRQSR